MSHTTKLRPKFRHVIEPCVSARGFSLIEVMVALSILSIGILATMQMGLLARYTITSGNIVTRAVLLGQSEVEKLKHFPINEVREVFSDGVRRKGPFTVHYNFSDPLAGQWQNGRGFNCETTGQDGSGSCMASVTVSWRRGGKGRGAKGSVKFRTLLYGGEA